MALVQWPHACSIQYVSKRVLQFESSQAWKARPGHRILVIDNGALRFEFPSDWAISVDEKHVQLTRQPEPDDRCGLILSSRLSSPHVAGVPLNLLLDDITDLASSDARTMIGRGPTIQLHRPPQEAAWIQMRFYNPEDAHETCSRICLARAGCTMAIIVFDFWPEDELALCGVWSTFLETLVVGEYFADPATGKRREQWG